MDASQLRVNWILRHYGRITIPDPDALWAHTAV